MAITKNQFKTLQSRHNRSIIIPESVDILVETISHYDPDEHMFVLSQSPMPFGATGKSRKSIAVRDRMWLDNESAYARDSNVRVGFKTGEFKVPVANLVEAHRIHAYAVQSSPLTIDSVRPDSEHNGRFLVKIPSREKGEPRYEIAIDSTDGRLKQASFVSRVPPRSKFVSRPTAPHLIAAAELLRENEGITHPFFFPAQHLVSLTDRIRNAVFVGTGSSFRPLHDGEQSYVTLLVRNYLFNQFGSDANLLTSQPLNNPLQFWTPKGNPVRRGLQPSAQFYEKWNDGPL